MLSAVDVGSLEVFLGDRHVGTLARDDEGMACFEYAAGWLADGFSISPLSLPLEARLFRPGRDPFDGMFGVFAGSLPDGWGRLLVDRSLRARGVEPERVDELGRLALVGSEGMGALRYEPTFAAASAGDVADFDEFAASCRAVLADRAVDDLDELLAFGGSSGGARPKALITHEGAAWIVKFPTRSDGPDAGRLEFEFAECACACGVRMPETRLFPSRETPGYFGVRRFDREGGERVHMVSAAGLLEASHRLPSLDYRELMQLTLLLTDSMAEVEQMFRLMCFNVFAHNQDDHAKNFSFLCRGGRWELSPAYDLTYSTVFGNEHSTSANGNGNPTMEDVMAIAREFGLADRRAASIAGDIRDATRDLLQRNGLAP